MTEENQRNNRKELIGVVLSKIGDKSIKVVYEYKTPHPLYKKEIRRKTTFHVHDESNDSGVGDKVKIIKFRRRKHSRKQMGHRQWFTEVKITGIKG